MANKKFIATVKVPQLAASHYYHSTPVEAASIELALKRAWQIIKKRPHVKGKRIKQVQITLDLEG
jgi:hypothetical protein